jgi:hypothetical protein
VPSAGFARDHCAHQCAQTWSDDHHPAANANQVLKRKTGRNLKDSGPFHDLGQIQLQDPDGNPIELFQPAR